MPPRVIQPSEVSNSIEFPLAGVDLTRGFEKQPRKPLVDGSFAYTTVKAVNTRSFDPATDRARGGSRPGLAKYGTGVINDPYPFQDLNYVTVTALVTGGVGRIPGSGISTPHIFLRKTDYVSLSYGAAAGPWDFWSPVSGATSIAGVGAAGGSTAFVLCLIGSTPSWRIVSNAQLVAQGSLPGNPSLAASAVTTDGTSFYACGQNQGSSSPGAGTFYAIKVSTSGTVTWSTANVGSLTTSVRVNDPTSCVVYSGSLYASFPGTGIVQVNATTGAAGSPLIRVSDSAITASTSGTYRMQRRLTPLTVTYQPTGQIALAGSVLAIAGESTQANNYQRAVIYYDLSGLTLTPAYIAGSALSDTNGTAQASPGNAASFVSITSDGSNLYALLGNASPNTPGTNNFVVKLDGTLGTKLAASSRFGVMSQCVHYASSLSKLVVSGPVLSKFLNTADMSENGGGLGSGLLSMFDAGSVNTTNQEYADDGNAVGGFNKAVALTGVAGGTVKVLFNNEWRPTISGGGTISSTAKVVRSTVNRGKMFFVDDIGNTYALYNPVTNSVENWNVTSGSLPTDTIGRRARLIETWRGRVLLSGLPDDPANLFASKINDAFNYNYSPTSISPSQAFAMNTAPQGRIPDVITGMVPFSDDILVIGCDHELWQLTGDPMAGGKKDRISSHLGMAWGRAWTMDPYGQLYFMSNTGAIYTFNGESQPIRISQPIDGRLRQIDLRKVMVTMYWNDRQQAIHVFATNYLASTTPVTHYTWEHRTGSWHYDEFSDGDHNPLCGVTFQGNSGSNRTVILGGNDGYARFITDLAPDDDGQIIYSEVWLGPILTKDLDEIIQKDIQAILGKDSGPVDYDIHVGNTAEEAYASTSVASGTLYAGRSTTLPTNRAGHAIYVKLTSEKQWALEAIRERLVGTGAVRRRGR